MKQKDIDMVEKIFDTEYVGYAYVYPEPDQPRKEYMLATTPENLANFISSQGAAAVVLLAGMVLAVGIAVSVAGSYQTD